MMLGLWRGQVTSVTPDGSVWVKVPRLRDADFGPVENLTTPLILGDRCLVGSREGRNDAIEIVRQLP